MMGDPIGTAVSSLDQEFSRVTGVPDILALIEDEILEILRRIKSDFEDRGASARYFRDVAELCRVIDHFNGVSEALAPAKREANHGRYRF